jgi:hypothetical protein
VRVALATCSAWPELDEDGPALLAALADEGLEVDVRSWDDPGADWPSYDLVVIRNTWDYWDRREEYVAWTRRVPRLANTADVVAWNTDKTYLRELDVPTVPTTWLEPGEPFTPPAHRFVVKPSVSAGARDTAAYDGGDPSAQALVDLLHARGKTVMVQPYVDAVDSEGETAVLVFGGEVSHAARKSACLVPGAGVPELGSWTISPREPSAAEVDLALRVVAGRDLLYARVDLLPGPVLVELEVTEPSLMLRHAPGSAARFARAVRERAERSTGAATTRP